MNRVLVTGATGFVGRHCIPELLEKGHQVHGVFSATEPSPVPGVTWHQANLLDSTQMIRLIREVAPTHLLHLAWTAKPKVYVNSPENLSWLRASVELVQLFRDSGGTRLVGAGTCFEYDWSYGFCREPLTPLHPSTLYGTCKHALQLALTGLCTQTELSCAWGRIFFLYGPHEHPDRLVSSVIKALLEDREAPCSTGTQIRDFLHVRDVARALVALLDSDVSGPVNIASGHPIAVKDVIASIAEQLGRHDLVKLGAFPSRPNDPPVLFGDASRLGKEVNFSPVFDLESGLADAIAWWRAFGLQQQTGKSSYV